MEVKGKRLMYRIIILSVMAIMIGYAVYQNMEDDQRPIAMMKGNEATNFSGETLNREMIELHKVGADKTLINFWGSWCEPCKREMPVLEQAYKENQNNGFQIISINVGDTKLVMDSFVKRYNLSFPIIKDQDRSIMDSYNVMNLPATFVVNSDGIIEQVHEGELTKEMLIDWLN